MSLIFGSVLALVLSGCLLRADTGPGQEPGPEQFVFTLVPGPGKGEAANQAVSDMAATAVDDADHRASVSTPLGRIDLYDYTEVREGRNWICQAVVGNRSASTGCTDDPAGLVAIEDGAFLAAPGVGNSEGWATVELQAVDAAEMVVGTAVDGTVYRSNLIDGFGLIVYPVSRGDLSLQAFDADDEPLGDPIPVDIHEGGAAAPSG